MTPEIHSKHKQPMSIPHTPQFKIIKQKNRDQHARTKFAIQVPYLRKKKAALEAHPNVAMIEVPGNRAATLAEFAKKLDNSVNSNLL